MTKKERQCDIQKKIEEYFVYCDSLNEGQKDIVKPYTLSGLLCYVGLTRAEFEKLCRIKRHEGILRTAQSKIEAFIEENMLTGALSCNASLNSLKYNFDWGEKTPTEENPTSRHITVTLSPDMAELAR